jgi:hypothetical protein
MRDILVNLSARESILDAKQIGTEFPHPLALRD